MTGQTKIEINQAVEDAVFYAREAFYRSGWRRAPCQSPLMADLIKGKDTKAVIKLSRAWNQAYIGEIMSLTA